MMLGGLLPSGIGGSEVAAFCLSAAAVVYGFSRLRTRTASLPGWMVFLIAAVIPLGAALAVKMTQSSVVVAFGTAALAVAIPFAVVLSMMNLLVVGELVE